MPIVNRNSRCLPGSKAKKEAVILTFLVSGAVADGPGAMAFEVLGVRRYTSAMERPAIPAKKTLTPEDERELRSEKGGGEG
jgi:hypothetical protein